jgi:hypothetical protein
VLRCTALADRITGASSSVEPTPHLRARRPQPHRQSHRRFVTASPIGRQQHTHVVPPCLRPFSVRPPILQHDPGLAASPPVCYRLRVARSEISLPLPFRPLGTDKLLAKRRRTAYGGTRRWVASMKLAITPNGTNLYFLKNDFRDFGSLVVRDLTLFSSRASNRIKRPESESLSPKTCLSIRIVFGSGLGRASHSTMRVPSSVCSVKRRLIPIPGAAKVADLTDEAGNIQLAGCKPISFPGVHGWSSNGAFTLSPIPCAIVLARVPTGPPVISPSRALALTSTSVSSKIIKFFPGTARQPVYTRRIRPR